jgi:hypothetical protein
VAVSTNKKVLLARFDREPLEGFVQMPLTSGEAEIELLTPASSLIKVPLADAKAFCFVRDFDTGEIWKAHRAFLTRPKAAGLWVRLRFRDGDSMEGMLPNNLLAVEPGGFNIVPPDPTFQNQRIFVPQTALTEVQVLGVIGSPLKRKPARKELPVGQIELFNENH